MARTIQQIETDIDNNAIIKIVEYLKDYLVKQLNIVVADVDGELQKVFTEVQGLENIVQTIPEPLEPSATDYTTRPNGGGDLKDGDMFFNTTDHKLKYWKTDAWHDIASIGAVIDAYTKAEMNTKLDLKADKVDLNDYELKSNKLTPTASHQSGYIILDETDFKDRTVGTIFDVNLSGLDSLGAPAEDTDRLFIGISGTITISNNVYLKFASKTNPTDTNVKDNFQTHDLILEKLSATEYRVKSWKEKDLLTRLLNNQLTDHEKNSIKTSLGITGV